MICKELGIDDPITWMNRTDPKVLDLWVAEMIFSSEENRGLIPAEQAFQQLASRQWPTSDP